MKQEYIWPNFLPVLIMFGMLWQKTFRVKCLWKTILTLPNLTLSNQAIPCLTIPNFFDKNLVATDIYFSFSIFWIRMLPNSILIFNFFLQKNLRFTDTDLLIDIFCINLNKYFIVPINFNNYKSTCSNEDLECNRIKLKANKYKLLIN